MSPLESLICRSSEGRDYTSARPGRRRTEARAALTPNRTQARPLVPVWYGSVWRGDSAARGNWFYRLAIRRKRAGREGGTVLALCSCGQVSFRVEESFMADKAKLVTGVFKTRVAAEAAVDAILKRGYTRDDISVLMSDATKSKEFAIETRTE